MASTPTVSPAATCAATSASDVTYATNATSPEKYTDGGLTTNDGKPPKMANAELEAARKALAPSPNTAMCTETAWFALCHTREEEHRVRKMYSYAAIEIQEEWAKEAAKRAKEAAELEATLRAIKDVHGRAFDIVHGAFKKLSGDIRDKARERWKRALFALFDEYKESNQARYDAYCRDLDLAKGFATWKRKTDELEKKYDAASDLAEKEFNEATKAANEEHDHDKAVIDAADEPFEGVYENEVKIVAELLVRDRYVGYVLPPEVRHPLRELERSWLLADAKKEGKARARARAAAEDDARVRLVEFRIKRVKGSSLIAADLRPAKGLRKRRKPPAPRAKASPPKSSMLLARKQG